MYAPSQMDWIREREYAGGVRSHLLPVEDTQFLLRDEMRAIRFALEYAKAELALRDWGIRSTIIVFGGARIPSPEQAGIAAERGPGRSPEGGRRTIEEPVALLSGRARFWPHCLASEAARSPRGTGGGTM